jgi:alkylated DNA nucleotide flippase Atl1
VIVLSLAEPATNTPFVPWMRVINPAGTQVAENWDAAATQISLTAQVAGTYTVRVASRDTKLAATGDYRIILARGAGTFVVPAGDEGGPMTNGANHIGAIDVGDLDMWSFSAAVGETFALSLAEPAADAALTPWLRVYSPAGRLVLEDWNNVATQVSRTATEPGVYTVIVGTRDVGLDATGAYQLVLAKAPGGFVVPAGDDGGPVTNGANQAGTIAPGDLDMWTFDATQGESFVLSLAERSGDPDFMPWIRVIAPSGRLILEDWNTVATQVAQTATETGTFTVIVGTRDVGLDATGTYQLILAKAPGAFVVPAGDDGGAMMNGANHAGTIDPGDLDMWTFSAAQGESFVLSLAEQSGDPDFVPWIRVIAPSGKLILENWNSVATQVAQTATETGTFTVIVGTRDVGLDARGTYRLIVARTPGTFTVSAGDEGGPIAVPTGSSGSIEVGDLDLWTFSAASGAAIVLTMQEVSGDADFIPWIRLYGPTGALLSENWAAASVAIERLAPADGVYTVIVSTRDTGLDAMGAYMLTVSGTGVSATGAGGSAPRSGTQYQ